MARAIQNVVHPDEVDPQVEGGAEIRTTFDERNGSPQLRQRIVRFRRGRSDSRRLDGQQEILYVVSGRGTLELDGDRHRLAPGTGVFIASGETYAIEADEDLELVSVLTPREAGPIPADRKVTVPFEEKEELEASVERTFRCLIDRDAGCDDVTQFVGIVQPSKVAFHSHPYDEVGYIIEGKGVAYFDEGETPLRAGSCFHLAPGQMHIIENSGPGSMRILGVFHPSGSPADRNG